VLAAPDCLSRKDVTVSANPAGSSQTNKWSSPGKATTYEPGMRLERSLLLRGSTTPSASPNKISVRARISDCRVPARIVRAGISEGLPPSRIARPGFLVVDDTLPQLRVLVERGRGPARSPPGSVGPARQAGQPLWSSAGRRHAAWDSHMASRVSCRPESGHPRAWNVRSELVGDGPFHHWPEKGVSLVSGPQ
jgi:hypothetical protein